MTCPDCKKDMTGVQYRMSSQDYDGVSEWICENGSCAKHGQRIGRWSNQVLLPGEIERRYGGTPAPATPGMW